ncbi:MAG: hypothetical protein LLF86_06530 [Nitrospiraceae bacterium]|nr:hypothetical protein [Nitrospiraceae bacterium]
MLFYKDKILPAVIFCAFSFSAAYQVSASGQDAAPTEICQDRTTEYVDQIRRQQNEIDKLRAELGQTRKKSELELAELQRRISLLQSALDLAASKPEEREALLKQAEKGINENNPRLINLMMRLNKAEEDLRMQTLINSEKTSEIVHLRKELREKDKECSVVEIIEKETKDNNTETVTELEKEIEELETENQELTQQIEILRNIIKKQQGEIELLKIKD